MPMAVRTRFRTTAAALLLGAAALTAQYGPGRVWWDAGRGGVLPWEESYDDPDGQVGILNAKGALHTDGHPFFEPLGRNGRACVTCHQPSNAMSLGTAAIRERWRETNGKDPLFAAVDGSNCPDLNQAEIASHSLILERGLFRISLPWPPTGSAEFRIDVVRDPTGCNTSPVYGLKAARPMISVFRRPRVAANLSYLVAGPDGVTLMADGRAPSLEAQAAEAARAHEEAQSAPGPDVLRRIVEFEKQIFTAQNSDIRGGLLSAADGSVALGPNNLALSKAGGLSGELLSFDVWKGPNVPGDAALQRDFRASVARGSEVFFHRKFQTGGAPESSEATCSTCHSSGSSRWMDIGTANVTEATASRDLPLFRVTCTSGRVIYTQDPGRALITGKCADVGLIVMQQFRGLAARAPYFSNGSAPTLRDVIDFYNRRFGIGYTEAERRDLLNFLRVL
jgi:cytochrome c peroxidase